MNLLKHFLSFTRKEQAAILVLLVLFISLAGVNLFVDQLIPQKSYTLINLDSLLASLPKQDEPIENERTSQFEIANPEASVIAQQLHPFPFNPNKLAEEDWKKIGLSDRQIRNIKNYEAKGGKFFIKEDLKKIYSLSAAEYAVLEPFINIPAADATRGSANKDVKEQIVEIKENKAKSIPQEAIELNTADSLQLIQIPGIGQWFAHRILQYRNILGGFVSKDQLLEIYGVDSTKVVQFESYLKINSTLIAPLRINHLSFKELLKHPYLDYELTKTISNQRDKRGFISSEEELAKLKGFEPSVIQKLRPYLNYE